MASIPSYYNNFKKEENQPEEMVDLKKMFLGLLGLAAVTSGAVAQKPPVNVEGLQVVRNNIFTREVLSGNELADAREYIKALEAKVLNEAKEDKEEIERLEREAREAQNKADKAKREAKKAKQNEAVSDGIMYFLQGMLMAGE
jgi:multidrug resistance efflux pump